MELARIILPVAAICLASAQAYAADSYPTLAVVDYVYGCMKANGETRAALENCSCSIDVIASIVPYERYEAAEAFKSLGLLTGERGVLFRQSAPARAALTELKRAQAEAEVRCF
ncbi:hypothetical protein MRS76_19665 [Rhizobiaceae bacterium n13]|uniref:Uncharacterized protein n=2 Tax=Ferirhizobium litorale TaxID=2927786 RepID=A0AAE3QDM5_9HYPH|nr:hypothetical protein [Fererhizobium litorale]MDI7864166.1 hypothetical protein [Fererhizobium litorale]MDI7923777.1 hypothetical protein [Fererhizobium litorale]